MKKIHEKIMRTDFAKSLKKLIIFAACVVLLGGVSVAMLAPQIGEAVSGIRQWEQDGEENRGDGEQDGKKRGDEEQNRKEFRENGEGGKELNDREGKEGDGREECDFLKNVTISMPTVGAVITLGITVLCGFLSLFLFWLLVAAWLYQAAIKYYENLRKRCGHDDIKGWNKWFLYGTGRQCARGIGGNDRVYHGFL